MIQYKCGCGEYIYLDDVDHECVDTTEWELEVLHLAQDGTDDELLDLVHELRVDSFRKGYRAALRKVASDET